MKEALETLLAEISAHPHSTAEAAIEAILKTLTASPHSAQFAELRAGLAQALLSQGHYWDSVRRN